MKDHQKRAIGMLIMLFMTVFAIAFMPQIVNLFRDEAAIAPQSLPDDLCIINGKPLTPELDYIGYGGPEQGLVLKYINQEGDLVITVEGEIIGVYTGDFCHD